MTHQSRIDLLSAAAKNIAAASTTSTNEFDVAIEELHVAYRDQVRRIMAGALHPGSQEVHLELLADAELCLARFRSARAWIERQRQVALPPSTQS